MKTRGSITLDDAQLISDFARHAEVILRKDYQKMAETAKTVGRIAYCAIAEARMNARAERARQGHYSDPYTTEVIE